MEAPPTYRPQKKSNIWLWIILGGLGLCCLGGAALLGGGAYFGMKVAGPMVECMMSAEFLQKAVVAYAEDNGGKLPAADKWQDQVKPYYERIMSTKGDKMKGSPFKPFAADGDWGCKLDNDAHTTFAFNTALSGKKLDDIQNKSETVLFFEVDKSGRNVNQKYDPAKLGTPPKRFPEAHWTTMSVDGDAHMVGATGQPVKGDGNVKTSVKFD